MSELFLFAGTVVEPDVTVDRTKVDYGALMIGAALKETFHIVNREAMPHSFVFDKSSLGMAQVIRVLFAPFCFFPLSGRQRRKMFRREKHALHFGTKQYSVYKMPSGKMAFLNLAVEAGTVQEKEEQRQPMRVEEPSYSSCSYSKSLCGCCCAFPH